MSADVAALFGLQGNDLILALLVVGFILVWRRIDKHADRLYAKVEALDGRQTAHEVACAKRDGETSAQLETLTKQVDTYTDARFDVLEKAVGQGRLGL